jgi:glycosidase
MKDEDPDKVYGQIWLDGQTGSGVSQHMEWKAQLLYKKGSGSAEYPVIAGTWNKVDAVFNSDHSGDNNHEYMAEFPTSKAGSYIYIFRFSLDGGATWWYGDKGVGENMEPGPKFITSSDNHPGKATINTRPKVLLELENYSKTSDSLHFELVYKGASPLDLTASKVTMNNEVQDAAALYDEETKRFIINETSLSPNKYSWLFRLVDTSGSRIEPFFVPTWIGEGVDFADFGWRDAFIYQLMTDRFLNGDTSNDVGDLPGVTQDLEQWKGGDFRGIIKKIEEGYFTDMGVNAIWISSPVLNPHTASQGGTSSSQSSIFFTSYHAYHPVATGVNFDDDLGYENEGIDTAFGTAAELHELVEKAHERGIRVVPDFAANHVHSDAKLYQMHKNDGWFYPQVACADGNNWEDHRIDCWFTPYMPDFNYGSNPDARKTVIDHAIWLIQNFNLDGFRADALKHMDDIFIIELRTAIKNRIETTVTNHDMPDEAEVFYTVGESLGGDWPRYHTRPNMVQGQVSDQYFYNVRDNIFYGGNYADLASRAINLDTTYQSVGGNGGGYPGAVMGNFFGNHDQDRALTFCNGDYNKLKQAQTMLLTSPINIPMLYQGDDIGTYGKAENGFDGGRRAVMKFSGLSGDEQAALNHVKMLGRFRKQHPALRHSTRTTCHSDSNVWLYKFEYDGDVVIAGLNKGGSAYTGSCGISGTFTSFDGSSVNVQNGQVTIPANGSLVIGK